MRPTAIFFLYLFSCLALAASLTHPLMLTGWIDFAPHRVMSRLAQLFILIGLWPFLKIMGLGSRDTLGYGAPRPVILGALWRGWVTGVGILLILSATLLLLGVRVPESLAQGWPGELAARALKALIGGLLIGLLEETFFRGALFGAVRRRGGACSAILWTAALYALLHFMKPGPLPDGVSFDAAGAARMFAEVFSGVFNWGHLDSMTALFLVGVFLALVRERTGHIGWCIGLHAGWVFVIQVTRGITDANPEAATAWLAGDYDGVIGWLAAAWIGLLTAIVWIRVSFASSRTAPSRETGR